MVRSSSIIVFWTRRRRRVASGASLVTGAMVNRKVAPLVSLPWWVRHEAKGEHPDERSTLTVGTLDVRSSVEVGGLQRGVGAGSVGNMT